MALSTRDEARVYKHSLPVKHDFQLTAMRVSHQDKLDKLRAPGGEVKKHTDPDGIAAIKWELKQQGLDSIEVSQELFDRQVYWIWKDTTLAEIVDAIDIEVDARTRKLVTRTPIGTVYYIDSDNGTNSYTGVKIIGTIDSSADSTHFVDTALTGADDYINGSFFFNETTGASTQILDFVAATDTVTLTDADCCMNTCGGDTYYILHAWVDLDQFTENARSAGDIVRLRRGRTATYDDGTDLVFTSDGTLLAPIQIEADYDDEWKDHVDLSGTATATLTFGSKTVTFSADVSSVVAAGDWIYAASDDVREFAYEVDSVSTVTVTLFLPYKGAQGGSGKTMTNMQSTPLWNTAAGDFRWIFNQDHNWLVQGIHIRGTDSLGNVGFDSAVHHQFKDCIFEGNGASDNGLDSADDIMVLLVNKCRFFNHTFAIAGTLGAAWGQGTFTDCLFDGNSVASSTTIDDVRGFIFTFIDCEFTGHALADISWTGARVIADLKFRNPVFGSATEVSIDTDDDQHISARIEDYDGTLNDSRTYGLLASGSTTPVTQSEGTKVRSGGGTRSIKVTPGAKMMTSWGFSRQLIFEYPIHATTDSKTYTVYFASDDNTDWTADPSASELWIELEYWGHASNNFRRITRSTGTIDFSTDTDFDQTLAVTVAPAQTGVAYLRAYYAKTLEGGNSNIFYCDPRIEIT